MHHITLPAWVPPGACRVPPSATDHTTSLAKSVYKLRTARPVIIPDGLYDVEGLQRAVNMAVNGVSDPRARGHYYMRPAGYEQLDTTTC